MSMMDELRKVLKPWLADNGMKPTCRKNIFYEDRGIFFIVLELQPLYNEGFLVNMVISFMWSSDQMSYDYEYKSFRVNSLHPLGATFFDSPTFDKDMAYIQSKIIERINEYREHSDLAVLEDRLANREDFRARSVAGYKDRDIDLANVRMMMGKVEEAKRLYINATNYKIPHPFAQEMVDANFDKMFFDERMLQIINENRAGLSRKFKIKLESIDSFEYLK